MKIQLTFVFTLGLFSLCTTGLLGQSLLLEEVQVIDPTTETVKTGYVEMKDGKLVAIHTKKRRRFKGQRVNLKGKYLVPGFSDMHVHSYGNFSPTNNYMDALGTDGTAKHMLYCGVVRFLDLFLDEDYIFGMRDKQRSEGLAGADIYCAGPMLTATGGHGTEYGVPTRIINTPEEATNTINDLARRKPDVIKIVYDHNQMYMPTIDKPTMVAAVNTAKANGLSTVIHMGSWNDVIDVLEAGATAITHVPPGPMPPRVAELMVEKNAYAIPTFCVQGDLPYFSANPKAQQHPLLNKVTTPELMTTYQDTLAYTQGFKFWMVYQRLHIKSNYAAMGQLNAAGAQIMTGTDVGNPGTFQGYSLHRELVHLVNSGLTNWQALRATTTLPCKFLGLPAPLAPQAAASFVVLNTSPVDDIHNTTDIHMVIHHGKIVDREALLDK